MGRDIGRAEARLIYKHPFLPGEQLERGTLARRAPISAVLCSSRCIRETHPSGSDSHGCGRSISRRTATKCGSNRSCTSFQLLDLYLCDGGQGGYGIGAVSFADIPGVCFSDIKRQKPRRSRFIVAENERQYYARLDLLVLAILLRDRKLDLFPGDGTPESQ